MKFSTLNFQSNPNIGLFAFVSDKLCFVNRFIRKKDADIIARVLKVPVYEASVLQTGFLGIFIAGNSKGIIISDRIYREEIDHMLKNAEVLVLETVHTGLGNMILANDKGCIISKELEEYGKDISDFLGVEAKTGTIGGMDLVGSLAAANSKGCLVHNSASEKEKKLIEGLLDVTVSPGSVNFGNQWIRSCIIANSNGFLAGDQTSGPELGLIAETLGFV
jgi:translation initiation factor 6